MIRYENILARAVDLEKLLKDNPDLFDFNRLTIFEKITLLNSGSQFDSKIDISKFSIGDKVELAVGARRKALINRTIISEDDIASMPNDFYERLLHSDFRKYVRASKFKKLSNSTQLIFISENPLWASDNLDIMPAFTSDMLAELARSAPWFIDKHISDFKGLSTYAEFWINMISHNGKYKKIFLDNTACVINKTEVRRVVRKFPSLIKLITGDTFVRSKLTVKEWILLISGLMDTKDFENWTFDPEVAEIMKMDLMADMLSGKSKTSTRFQNSMRIVLPTPEESLDEEYLEDMKNEDTTMVGPSP